MASHIKLVKLRLFCRLSRHRLLQFQYFFFGQVRILYDFFNGFAIGKHIKRRRSALVVTPLFSTLFEALDNISFDDIEDSFQYQIAVISKCEAFLTQNIKDFPDNGEIKILTPQEFLK